jgi:tetratricopeptide (TPR) repeat protein
LDLAVFLVGALWGGAWTANGELRSVQEEAGKELPPFDRLELFAFVAAGPEASYLRKVVAERGTDFTPDAEFLAAFRFPAQVEILQSIKARETRTISADRDAAYALARQAVQAGDQRNRVLAAEKYEQALQLAPESATLHTAYAANFLLWAQGAKAEIPARQAVALWPGNCEAHGILALALISGGKVAEGAAEAREALRIYPAHQSAKFSLGLSLVRNFQYDEAIPVLRQGIVEMPSLAEMRKLLGLALVETNKADEAMRWLAPYVKDRPKDAEGHYDLGLALRKRGEVEKAHAEFEEAARLEPGRPLYAAAANPDARTSAASASSVPQPSDDSVSGNTYRNEFFGLSYDFPKGWTRLSAEAAKASVEIGGVMLMGNDPAEPDIRRAALKMGYPLLFVVAPGGGGQPLSARSLQITALDVRTAPEGFSLEEFLKGVRAKLQRAASVPTDAKPERVIVDGREFWKLDVVVPMSGGSRYLSQMVTAERGFFLMFVMAGPDVQSISEIGETMQSVRFSGKGR